jgi:hypothetical protein
MSAFLLSEEQIHKLVVALKVDGHFADQDRSALGAKLITMNEAAVNARYNEANKRNEPYVWQEPAVMTAVEAYKLIRCYLYQCSEDDVPSWLLFDEVTAVRLFYARLLGHDPVKERWTDPRRAAEYSAASWG